MILDARTAAAALGLPCKRVRLADLSDTARLIREDSRGQVAALALRNDRDEAALLDLLSARGVVVEIESLILLPRGVANDFLDTPR